MSYTKETTIWCDGDDCQTFKQFPVSSATIARDRLSDDGWVVGSGGDYCPGCSDE